MYHRPDMPSLCAPGATADDPPPTRERTGWDQPSRRPIREVGYAGFTPVARPKSMWSKKRLPSSLLALWRRLKASLAFR